MQIRFTFETQYGPFSDALYLDENHTFTEAEVEAMKQERLTNWIAILEAPPVEPDTVVIDGVTYEKIQIDGQVVLKPVGA